MNTIPSKLLEQAVSELASLPGIGRKTAMRMALNLLKRTPDEVDRFGTAIIKMRKEVIYCSRCGNISDAPVCGICSSPRRDPTMVCVVEDIRDIMAIENTGQYNGVYHVLGGIISPIDGIGPESLNIPHLLEKIANEGIKEIILALPTTIEGDTTNYFLYKKIRQFDISITTIARGIGIGDELEHADEVTLGRSILHRRPFEEKGS